LDGSSAPNGASIQTPRSQKELVAMWATDKQAATAAA